MATGKVSSRRRIGARWRLKFQLVSTVTGLALTVTLAVMVARAEDRPRTATPPAEQTSVASWQARPALSQAEDVAYYLVTSEEGEQRVRSWSWYEHDLLGSEAGYRPTKYVPVFRACDADSSDDATVRLPADGVVRRVQVFVAEAC